MEWITTESDYGRFEELLGAPRFNRLHAMIASALS